MGKNLLQIGKFMRVISPQGDGISITNIGCYIAMIKIALVPQASVADLGVLLISLLNYCHKRHVGGTSVESSLTQIEEVVKSSV